MIKMHKNGHKIFFFMRMWLFKEARRKDSGFFLYFPTKSAKNRLHIVNSSK